MYERMQKEDDNYNEQTLCVFIKSETNSLFVAIIYFKRYRTCGQNCTHSFYLKIFCIDLFLQRSSYFVNYLYIGVLTIKKSKSTQAIAYAIY